MRLDRLTVKAQEALQQAQTLAAEYGQQEIGSEHVLLALLEQPEGIVIPVLQKLGAQPEAVLATLRRELDKLPKVSGVVGGEYLSQRLKRNLEQAWTEAQKLKDEYLSTEHLLLAFTEEKDGATGNVLRAHGITRDRVLQALVEIRGSARVTDQNPEEKY